eukprot:5970013-Amphidinium_carterae.1
MQESLPSPFKAAARYKACMKCENANKEEYPTAGQQKYNLCTDCSSGRLECCRRTCCRTCAAEAETWNFESKSKNKTERWRIRIRS